MVYAYGAQVVHGTWVHEESTWVHYTWVCGTGLHMRGCRELEVKSGVYLEYLKLCHGTWVHEEST